MGKMKRMRKPPAWAGEPNARELELERQIRAIEARYEGVKFEALPKAVQNKYGRLHSLLLAESQRRSGLTLIKITENATGDSATYDTRALFRVVKAVEMLMAAGIPYDNAIVRAIEDERWRQQQEPEQESEPNAEKRGGLLGRIKDIFRPIKSERAQADCREDRAQRKADC